MNLYGKGKVPDATFTLPDGHVVHLGNERFRYEKTHFLGFLYIFDSNARFRKESRKELRKRRDARIREGVQFYLFL
jgi:hypothetical protein